MSEGQSVFLSVIWDAVEACEGCHIMGHNHDNINGDNMYVYLYDVVV